METCTLVLNGLQPRPHTRLFCGDAVYIDTKRYESNYTRDGAAIMRCRRSVPRTMTTLSTISLHPNSGRFPALQGGVRGQKDGDALIARTIDAPQVAVENARAPATIVVAVVNKHAWQVT